MHAAYPKAEIMPAVVTMKGMGQAVIPDAAGQAFAEVVRIMARLRGPGGCPWDREQTMDSIKPHTLEETYEVFDAIDRRAWPELRDELGDLLLQVIFYAQIAADDEHFNIEEVVRGLSVKLVRRHPHIFADEVADTAADVNRTWERVKQQERAGKVAQDDGLLADVPRFVPALVEARKLGSKAAKIGFDWPDTNGLFDKVQEEIAEVRAELTESPDASLVEEEIGDLFFVMTNLSRHLNVDPEQALRKANAKFRRRFSAMELAAGESLPALSLNEMDALWNAAKQAEKQA
jgi:ATP diphosphatase